MILDLPVAGDAFGGVTQLLNVSRCGREIVLGHVTHFAQWPL